MKRILLILLALAFIIGPLASHTAMENAHHPRDGLLSAASDVHAKDCGTDCDITEMLECCGLAIANCAPICISPDTAMMSALVMSTADPFGKNDALLSSSALVADPPPPRV